VVEGHVPHRGGPFSTLGYQPGIAALAAGALSPVATLLLVLLTLFGALPIYRRVAAESPNGEGSIAMLERLLSVAVYLALNLVVVLVALERILVEPQVVADWRDLLVAEHPNPVGMVLVALLVFPKLALGLSGFETGVAVMPLVRGGADDPPEHPRGRIRGTRKLLTTAALIMSGFLIASSSVTTPLIPAAAFEEGGEASGRALAYLAHEQLGDAFGTL
jgi:hypothetical protein